MWAVIASIFIASVAVLLPSFLKRVGGTHGFPVYRKRARDAIRPYRVPGYPLTPIVFIMAAAVLVINTIATQPGRSAVGLGIVCLGIPAWAIWRRMAKENNLEDTAE